MHLSSFGNGESTRQSSLPHSIGVPMHIRGNGMTNVKHEIVRQSTYVRGARVPIVSYPNSTVSPDNTIWRQEIIECLCAMESRLTNTRAARQHTTWSNNVLTNFVVVPDVVKPFRIT